MRYRQRLSEILDVLQGQLAQQRAQIQRMTVGVQPKALGRSLGHLSQPEAGTQRRHLDRCEAAERYLDTPIGDEPEQTRRDACVHVGARRHERHDAICVQPSECEGQGRQGLSVGEMNVINDQHHCTVGLSIVEGSQKHCAFQEWITWLFVEAVRDDRSRCSRELPTELVEDSERQSRLLDRGARPDHPRLGGRLEKRSNQRRLADTAGPTDEHAARRAGGRLHEGIHQRRQLSAPTNEATVQGPPPSPVTLLADQPAFGAMSGRRLSTAFVVRGKPSAARTASTGSRSRSATGHADGRCARSRRHGHHSVSSSRIRAAQSHSIPPTPSARALVSHRISRNLVIRPGRQRPDRGAHSHHTTEENRTEITMNLKSIKRILVTIGVTAGFLTVTATQASAAMNHSEPTLNRN